TVTDQTGGAIFLGDDNVQILGIVRGPVLAEQATSRTSGDVDEELVEMKHLLGTLSVHGGNDQLPAGNEPSILIGDSQMVVAAVAVGPLLNESALAPGSFTGQRFRSLVEFDELLDEVSSFGGKDTVTGGAGDDVLIGDDSLLALSVSLGAIP